MTDFLARTPSLDSNRRAVVLFGRNVASYGFAPAKTLLEMADRADDRVPLEDPAAPYARHFCEHLGRVDKQAASRSSQFLDACRARDKDELPEGKPVQTTVRLGFNNAIDGFHVVGPGPVPVRFCIEERSAGGSASTRLTDDLRRLAAPVQGGALSAEAESCWRLAATAR